MASKCNMFLDPSGFSSEDVSSPFSIPRTSSIAKSKRPSVSFAEGTRFSPRERRGSAQEPAALAGPSRNKPKPSSGWSVVPALQSQGEKGRAADEDERDEREGEAATDGKAPESQESRCQPADQEEPRPEPRRTHSNMAAHKGTRLPCAEAVAVAGNADKVTTVYVTVGKAGRAGWKAELNAEGPVQAVLRRLGSLQRQREQQNSGRQRPRAADGISKPPRKKLGARASVWEQGGPSATEVGVCKPIRRKQAALGSSETPAGADRPPADSGAPRRPLSSILKSAPEAAPAETGPGQRTEGAANQGGGVESGYLTVGPVGEAGKITEVTANQAAEPCYENVVVQHA